MHTRRVSTFLLGGWLGCSVFMAFVALENLHSAELVMNAPTGPVGGMIHELGPEQMILLLRHHSAEETRNLYYLWEQAQIGLALILGGCLYFATQKRLLSLVLCATMVALVIFQFFAITPELSYRGREMDFSPGTTASGAMMRTLLLSQLLVVTEGLKLVAGGALASYLFVFRTSRRRGGRRETDSSDSADTNAVETRDFSKHLEL